MPHSGPVRSPADLPLTLHAQLHELADAVYMRAEDFDELDCLVCGAGVDEECDDDCALLHARRLLAELEAINAA